ncbi:sulfatase-like hydrolase/transferase [Propionibacteriaceae bacterium Y1700]|uniref:sulfatase-like hydrolase/transferase n=1 Tax=Microlunatus sp. Y1700 TaxID=3418487 RepID=UPI003DA71ED7
MTASSPTPAAPAVRNVVLIMADQQRQGFTAGEGFALDTMPFCDSVAAGGRRFAHGFTPTPACVPARTSLLTGRYPSAHRVRQNSTNGQVTRGADLLDVVAAAGLQTIFAGKPHMYRRAEDFDQWSGPYMHTNAPAGTPEQDAFSHWLDSIDHGPSTEATPHPVEVQYPHRIVDDACRMLEQRDPERGTFLWVSFPEPHNPYQVPEPYWSLFDPDQVPDRMHGPEGALAKGGDFAWLQSVVEQKRPGYDELWRRYRASYCGMLRLIDDQLQRLVSQVQQTLGEDTLIIFVADHGDYVGEYGLQRKGAGMPDVLMRIPYWIAGPGVEPAVDRGAKVSLVDLMPTIAEALAQPIPLGVQGRSLWPLLTGEDSAESRAAFASAYGESGFGGLSYGVDERPELHYRYDGTGYDELNTVTQSGTSRMLHRGRWKLLFHSDGRGELYDVEADPTEMTNLYGDADLVELQLDLLTELVWWQTVTTDDLPEGVYTSKRPPHNWYGPEYAATRNEEKP